ncbi:MAG: hypothetical protein H7061_05400 [Bdellovibrionaceae bacterium]|nr:hypothetical protein [Bdellovibrio sp.]
MKNTILVLLLCTVAFPTLAAKKMTRTRTSKETQVKVSDDAKVETPTKPDDEEEEEKEEPRSSTQGRYADHNNYFSIGPVTSEFGSGVTLGYAFKVAPRLKLGVHISSVQGGRLTEGGTVSTGQYYKENYYHKATMSALSLSFYPREEGVSRWGPFLRAQVGYANVQSTSTWERYDQDPGFFTFGDGKRKLEEKSYERTWGTIYSRLGLYYQFAWNFGEGARVGHVLEMGAGVNSLANVESITYIKPNAQMVTDRPAWASAYAEIHYSIAF